MKSKSFYHRLISLAFASINALAIISGNFFPALHASEEEIFRSPYQQVLNEWTKEPDSLFKHVREDFKEHKSNPVIQLLFSKTSRIEAQVPKKNIHKEFQTPIDPYLDEKIVKRYGETDTLENFDSVLGSYCDSLRLGRPLVSIYHPLLERGTADNSPKLEKRLPLSRYLQKELNDIIKREKDHLLFTLAAPIVQNIAQISVSTKIKEKLTLWLQRSLGCMGIVDVTTKEGYQSLVSLYEFTHDIVFAFLAYQKPYVLQDYQDAMDFIYEKQYGFDERFPSNIKMFHIPCKSGHDAFNAALYFSHGQEKNKHITTMNVFKENAIKREHSEILSDPIYFEFELIINSLNTKKHDGKSRIFATGMTTESLFDNENLNTGYSRILDNVLDMFAYDRDSMENKKKFFDSLENKHPLYFIIDDTLMDSEHFLSYLGKRKDIEAEIFLGLLNKDKLALLFIRSNQKFATWGTGKVKVGNLTIIAGQKHPIFNIDLSDYEEEGPAHEFVAKEQWAEALYDLGYMTHLLKSYPNGEKEYTRAASQNAAQLQKIIENQKIGQSQANGPFIHTLEEGYDKLNLSGGYSFGFPYTSASSIGDIVRISVGLEPKPLLKEIIRPLETIKKKVKID